MPDDRVEGQEYSSTTLPPQGRCHWGFLFSTSSPFTFSEGLSTAVGHAPSPYLDAWRARSSTESIKARQLGKGEVYRAGSARPEGASPLTDDVVRQTFKIFFGRSDNRSE